MPLRRSLTLAGAVLAVVLPLSSCGFDNATDRINSITNGASQRDASVDVLGATIVSAEDGSGRFIASFVNNDLSEQDTVEQIVGTDSEQGVTAPDFSPLTIEPNSLLNLASDEEQPVEVTGQFAAGDYVPMSISFGSGEAVRLDVPVVTNCGDYEGLDGPGGDCEEEAPTGAHSE